jgi:Domain of unknown function (DUF5122) beta-propeller
MVIALAALASTPQASASVRQHHVVSAIPVRWTPHALDGTVRAFAIVGSEVVTGGTFTSIRSAKDPASIDRPYLFAFDRRTGALDQRFRPALDGPVDGLAAGPDGTVYVGGEFATVDGVAQRGITRLRVADGSRDGAFAGAGIDGGHVQKVILSGSRLYVAGDFDRIAGMPRRSLARLSAGTGAADPSFSVSLTQPMRGSSLRVTGMALNPAGDRLMIDGTFTRVNGAVRSQLAQIDTSTARPTSWSTTAYGDVCDPAFDTYMKGVDYSPDGSYFVAVTTGGPHGTRTMCDTAARWPASAGRHTAPTWVNYTGGHTLISVAVTGAAVYVGGHQVYVDNPHGNRDVGDGAGPGAVRRPGLAALSPANGRALSWNPTRDPLGYGPEEILASPDGTLLVGSDTDGCGHAYHARICEFTGG